MLCYDSSTAHCALLQMLTVLCLHVLCVRSTVTKTLMTQMQVLAATSPSLASQ
jgi:hypothetical protein